MPGKSPAFLVFEDQINTRNEQNRAGDAWPADRMDGKTLKAKMIHSHRCNHLACYNKTNHIGGTNVPDNENDRDDVARTEHTAHEACPMNLFQIGQGRNRTLIETQEDNHQDRQTDGERTNGGQYGITQRLT